MQPDYNPINFKQIDLRKYHIKDLVDVVKFTEFLIPRLEEVRQVVRTSNNRLGTLENINSQLRAANTKQIQNYGNPLPEANQEVKVESVKPAEATSAEAEHNKLLDELKEISSLGDDANERRTAEIEHGDDIYRITDGKKRPMFYKNGRLIATVDVPEDVKEELYPLIGRDAEGNEVE